MIKAVIFDCFGVLVAGTLERFIDEHLEGNNQHINRAHELTHQANLGLISYDDQLKEFAAMSGLSLKRVTEEMDKNPRNELLLDYIKRELKPKYKIGFLSNASDDWLEELFTPEDLQLFEDFVLSYSVKMSKPDVRIYELAASRLGFKTSECVFVDDIESYCHGAQKAGMKAIHYKDNFHEFKKDLQTLLSADLNT